MRASASPARRVSSTTSARIRRFDGGRDRPATATPQAVRRSIRDRLRVLARCGTRRSSLLAALASDRPAVRSRGSRCATACGATNDRRGSMSGGLSRGRVGLCREEWSSKRGARVSTRSSRFFVCDASPSPRRRGIDDVIDVRARGRVMNPPRCRSLEHDGVSCEQRSRDARRRARPGRHLDRLERVRASGESMRGTVLNLPRSRARSWRIPDNPPFVRTAADPRGRGGMAWVFDWTGPDGLRLNRWSSAAARTAVCGTAHQVREVTYDQREHGLPFTKRDARGGAVFSPAPFRFVGRGGAPRTGGLSGGTRECNGRFT